jgi:hypothetical protein
MNNDERQFNRLVLQFFADLLGIPQDLRSITEYVQGRVAVPCTHQVRRAVETLLTLKYLEPCGPSADEFLWTLTPAGLAQANRAVAKDRLDPNIWADAR